MEKTGQTSDVLLTQQRAEHAAQQFLPKAIRRPGGPENIPIAGSTANAAARTSSKAEHHTALVIRTVTYLHNIVAQDQRGVKRLARPMFGFKAFEAAQATRVGIARMPMIKQRQLVVEEGNAGRTAAEQFYALAAYSPPQPGATVPSCPPEHNVR